MAESDLLIAKKIKKTLTASETLTIDSIPLANVKSLRYFFTVWDVTRTKSFDISVVNSNGVISDTLYGKIGSAIDILVSAEVSGSDIILKVTNNEASAITVEVLRFKIGR